LEIFIKGAEWVSRGVEPFIGVPRFKGILDICQAGFRKFWIMAKEDGFQIRIIDPL
jgi:hypothetical protein